MAYTRFWCHVAAAPLHVRLKTLHYSRACERCVGLPVKIPSPPFDPSSTDQLPLSRTRVPCNRTRGYRSAKDFSYTLCAIESRALEQTILLPSQPIERSKACAVRRRKRRSLGFALILCKRDVRAHRKINCPRGSHDFSPHARSQPVYKAARLGGIIIRETASERQVV